MNSLDDIPFQTPLGSLEEPMREFVTGPDIAVPDCRRILQETEYEFNLENWVLTRLHGGYRKPQLQAQCRTPTCGGSPSCPPYWLLFSSPQESRWASRRSSDLWASTRRPRSHSLSSVDTHRLYHRSIKFPISDSEDEAGYSEDDEGSSNDDARVCKSRERPKSTASKDLLTRVKALHLGLPAHCGKPVSPRNLTGPKATLSAFPNRRGALSALEQSQPSSPLCQSQRHSKRRQRSLGSVSKRHSQSTKPVCQSPSKLQQPRPSSAGPVVRNHRQKALRPGGSHKVFFDLSAELLSALSQEERELLEAITERGYSLRTAIVALQKTGYRNPEKILTYLVASNRLCELGYDEAQVEEALEMFQNCESKAAEFLRLLKQFNEMGFQQSAIKEVLLIHENHREKALEELMTHTA